MRNDKKEQQLMGESGMSGKNEAWNEAWRQACSRVKGGGLADL